MTIFREASPPPLGATDYIKIQVPKRQLARRSIFNSDLADQAFADVWKWLDDNKPIFFMARYEVDEEAEYRLIGDSLQMAVWFPPDKADKAMLFKLTFGGAA